MPKLPSFLLPTEGISTAQNAPSIRGISAQAFNTQAEGLGDLAKGILSISPLFEKYAHEVQGMENSRTISEARTTLATQAAELQNSLMLDNDPASHVAKTSEFIARQREAIEQANYTPAAREAIANHFTEFSTSFQINNAKNAALLSERRTKLQLDNELSLAAQNRDHAQFQSTLQRGVESGVLLPEEEQAAIQKYETRQREEDLQNEITQSPTQFLAKHEGKAPPAGKTPYEWEQTMEQARRLKDRRTSTVIDSFNDDLATGSIKSAEDIKSRYGDQVRPSVLEKMTSQFLQRTNTEQRAQLEAMRNDPVKATETLGKIRQLFTSYKANPNKQNWDEQAVELNAMIDTLPKGAAKDEANRMLDSMRTEAFSDYKSTQTEQQKFAEQHINTAESSNFFGSPKKSFTPETLISDGFLKDTKKLEQIGLSKEQAEIISNPTKLAAAIAADPNGSKPWLKNAKEWQDNKYAGKQPSAITYDNKDRQELARIISGYPEGKPSIDPNTPEMRTFEAIRNGKTGAPIDEIDAAKQAKIQRAIGQSSIRIREWIDKNPTATKEEVQTESLRILTDEKTLMETNTPTTRRENQNFYGVSNLQSARITSFGYANDTTPDRNSSRGIAAFTTHEDEKALNASNGKANVPTRLQPNDIAVSPDIEKTFRENGLKPRDYVTVTLRDGTQITGRWMDKTADNLRGRIDLYSPNGTHPKDDSPVVTWQPASTPYYPQPTAKQDSVTVPINEKDIDPENPLLPPLNDAQIPSI